MARPEPSDEAIMGMRARILETWIPLDEFARRAGVTTQAALKIIAEGRLYPEPKIVGSQYRICPLHLVAPPIHTVPESELRRGPYSEVAQVVAKQTASVSAPYMRKLVTQALRPQDRQQTVSVPDRWLPARRKAQPPAKTDVG